MGKSKITIGTTYSIPFFMANISDHFTGETGLIFDLPTPNAFVEISKANGSFAPIQRTVVETGHGNYAVVLDPADTDTLGNFIVNIQAPGLAAPTDVHGHEVVADGDDVLAQLIRDIRQRSYRVSFDRTTSQLIIYNEDGSERKRLKVAQNGSDQNLQDIVPL